MPTFRDHALATVHGELIADLATKRSALCEAQVVGITGPSTADEARLLGYVSDVIPVTNPAWLRQGQNALIDHF